MTSGSRHPLKSRWIDEPAALDALVERLSAAERFAIDTESNSMHAYRERICLVQVSVDEDDFVIDPLAVDLTPLGAVLADASILKVMHGADYDVLCFKREYGFRIAGLFDTMLAARVLGWPKYGLGSILAERHDFKANKRMQRFDWAQRPLPEHALDYARYDTHFLLALHDDQRRLLIEAERDDEHAHACLRQTQVEPRPTKAERLGAWKIKGVGDLSAEARGILFALYALRETVAEEIDKPVFRVMGDDVLMKLAKSPPEDQGALRGIRGMHPRLRDRGRSRVMQAIASGRETAAPRRPPRQKGMTPEQTERFEVLRTWRKTIATERGVEPDIVLGKDSLIAAAEANPDSLEALADCGALDEWEMNRYGRSLIAALVNGA